MPTNSSLLAGGQLVGIGPNWSNINGHWPKINAGLKIVCIGQTQWAAATLGFRAWGLGFGALEFRVLGLKV